MSSGKEIGQGEFGSVEKGVYMTKNDKGKKEKIDVAIKVSRAGMHGSTIV